MKTISVICEKGGTGKTTLAVEMMRNFKLHGVKTSLYSLDGQYANPSWSIREDGAAIAVVDTPGVLADNLKSVIDGSDCIVVPVRPTPNDIEPFTRTVEIVRALTDAPLIIVVNGHNRWNMCASFMKWLEGKDWAKTIVAVPQSEALVRSQALGKSVCKTDKKSKAADAIEKLCRKSAKSVGLKLGKKSKKK